MFWTSLKHVQTVTTRCLKQVDRMSKAIQALQLQVAHLQRRLESMDGDGESDLRAALSEGLGGPGVDRGGVPEAPGEGRAQSR